MASQIDKRFGRDRTAVMAPYTVLPHGIGHPAWWLAPGLALFCFIYGLFFAATAPYLIVVCAIPPALLMLFAIWALPELRRAPVKAIAPLTFAFVIALVMWPNYLGVQLPGTPWFTLIRLIGVPLALILLVSVSVSKQFRSEILEVMNAAPIIWILVVAFDVINLITLPMAKGGIGASMSKVAVYQVNWFAMFFIGLWVFRKPGRVEKFGYVMWGMALALCLMGVVEHHQHKVLWQGHVPSFLKIDEAQRFLLSSFRKGTGAYRTKTTFTTPLGLSEFLALCAPFVLRFGVGPYKWWIRFAAFLSVPFMVYTIIGTDSRLGLIGTIIAVLLYTLNWGLLRWRGDKTSLMGPSVVFLGYPVIALSAISLTFISHRVHEMVWGGAAQRTSNKGRIEEWEKGIPKILHNPFGYGAGQGGQVLQYHSPGSWLSSVDSYWLTLLLDYGIAGFAIFIGMFACAIWYCAKTIWQHAAVLEKDKDMAFLTPIGITFVAFIIIKAVFTEFDIHPLLFLMLAMTSCLVLRVKQTVAAEAPVEVQTQPVRTPPRPRGLRPSPAV